jgi:hypothetical protein
LRLRLSPQSRTPTISGARPARSNGGQASSPTNYFERMRLENGEDA